MMCKQMKSYAVSRQLYITSTEDFVIYITTTYNGFCEIFGYEMLKRVVIPMTEATFFGTY